ncbi:MAG: hypothetical protein ACFWT6_08190 [Virgibacillus proomii]|jgi:hypothetical protein
MTSDQKRINCLNLLLTWVSNMYLRTVSSGASDVLQASSYRCTDIMGYSQG